MIRIEEVPGGFAVTVSPPHATCDWSSTGPLTPTDVLATLSRLGCHSTEITDALDATGADWRPTHNVEVARRRQSEPSAE